MADARATEEETEVDEMSIVRTGSIANHVNAKKFEMALHKSESLADYPAEKVWKHVDVDKSGGLDKKEFFEMYQLLQKHVDTQQKELVEEKHKIWESQVRLRMFKYFGLFLLFTMMLRLLVTIVIFLIVSEYLGGVSKCVTKFIRWQTEHDGKVQRLGPTS